MMWGYPMPYYKSALMPTAPMTALHWDWLKAQNTIWGVLQTLLAGLEVIPYAGRGGYYFPNHDMSSYVVLTPDVIRALDNRKLITMLARWAIS